MKLKAFGKINLGLRILRKREDGYHDIQTVLHLINCYDEIELKKRKDSAIIIQCNDPAIPTDESNLCHKAVIALREKVGIQEGVEIILNKGIAAGAGLGGGSSNAATVIKGLVEFWDLDVCQNDLFSIMSSIGSDTSFFLSGQTTFATGRGETLEAMDLSIPYWIVVVTPPIHISTSWAYNQFNPENSKSGNDNLRIALFNHLHDEHYLRNVVVNDFEKIVFQSNPEIASLKEQFWESGAFFALMNGSGSSVYGFFKDGKQAEGFIDRFSFPPYRVSLTEPYFKPEPDHFLIKH